MEIKTGDIIAITHPLTGDRFVVEIKDRQPTSAMVKIESSPGVIEFWGVIFVGSIFWKEVEKGELIDSL